MRKVKIDNNNQTLAGGKRSFASKEKERLVKGEIERKDRKGGKEKSSAKKPKMAHVLGGYGTRRTLGRCRDGLSDACQWKHLRAGKRDFAKERRLARGYGRLMGICFHGSEGISPGRWEPKRACWACLQGRTLKTFREGKWARAGGGVRTTEGSVKAAWRKKSYRHLVDAKEKRWAKHIEKKK